MGAVKSLVTAASQRARARRAAVFRENFAVTEHTKILDLGSEDGSNIHRVLQGTRAQPENVYIADISPAAVQRGHERYGFQAIAIDESEPLPFPDKFFDIVYCSSVIEHVTVPKQQIWTLYSGAEFTRQSRARQRSFADEIKRLGKHYFVQTPNKYFVIESHSWLPFISWLPRWSLIPVQEHRTSSFLPRDFVTPSPS
jgi:SAM-dependent methyltransferase